MKNEKNYMGFCIPKIWQILKHLIKHKPLISEVWTVSIEHSLQYTQAFSRSISNYTSNFRKLLWQKKHHSKTAACTLKCSHKLQTTCIVKLQCGHTKKKIAWVFQYFYIIFQIWAIFIFLTLNSEYIHLDNGLLSSRPNSPGP